MKGCSVIIEHTFIFFIFLEVFLMITMLRMWWIKMNIMGIGNIPVAPVQYK